MALGDAKLVMLAGAWFGVPGALFALLAGAVQGTIGAGIIYFFRGEFEEPEAVQRERAEIAKELLAMTPEERVEAEKELALDPLFEQGAETAGPRIAFGPFLALSILEYLLVGSDLLEAYVR